MKRQVLMIAIACWSGFTIGCIQNQDAGSDGAGGAAGMEVNSGTGDGTGGTAGIGREPDSGATIIGQIPGFNDANMGQGGTGGMATQTGTRGGGERAVLARTQACGHGAPCQEGATCYLSFHEFGINCTCDESGHFFCEDWWYSEEQVELDGCNTGCGYEGAGGGGGQGAEPRSCSKTNGFCTKTCVCGEGCEWDCSGEGPAPEEIHQCDPSYCEIPGLGDYGGFGCALQDGDCNYRVDCPAEYDDWSEERFTIEGECPAL